LHDVVGAAIQYAMRDSASPSGLRAVQEAVSEDSESSYERFSTPRKEEPHRLKAGEQQAGGSRGPKKSAHPQFKQQPHGRTSSAARTQVLPQLHDVSAHGAGGVPGGESHQGVGGMPSQLSSRNEKSQIRMPWAEDSTYHEPPQQGGASAPVLTSKRPPIPSGHVQQAPKLSFRTAVGASPAVNP
jgi:hypothetical protein